MSVPEEEVAAEHGPLDPAGNVREVGREAPPQTTAPAAAAAVPSSSATAARLGAPPPPCRDGGKKRQLCTAVVIQGGFYTGNCSITYDKTGRTYFNVRGETYIVGPSDSDVRLL